MWEVKRSFKPHYVFFFQRKTLPNFSFNKEKKHTGQRQRFWQTFDFAVEKNGCYQISDGPGASRHVFFFKMTSNTKLLSTFHPFSSPKLNVWQNLIFNIPTKKVEKKKLWKEKIDERKKCTSKNQESSSARSLTEMQSFNSPVTCFWLLRSLKNRPPRKQIQPYFHILKTQKKKS